MTIYYLIILALVAIVIGQFLVIVRLRRQARQEALGLDEVAEDAIKSLYHLSREQPVVPDRDLIRSAELQAGRFQMIQTELERRGWAQAEDRALRILPAGERRAVELIRAHRLWERYLAEKEGLPLVDLHAEAMRREHLISPEEADRLEEQLGFPTVDPHGDPIPPSGGD